MDEITALLLDLFIIFLAAKVAAELFEHIRQPPAIGELLAGVLIGAYALGLIVASLGLSLGAIPQHVFSVVVIMSILTTLVVPPVLRVLYAGLPETASSEEDTASQAGLLPDL